MNRERKSRGPSADKTTEGTPAADEHETTKRENLETPDSEYRASGNANLEQFQDSSKNNQQNEHEATETELRDQGTTHEEDYPASRERGSIEFPFAEVAKPTERRKTIYELDSYAASNISIFEGYEARELSSTEFDEAQEFRYSDASGMPGIARINLSPLTQKIIGCVIGENVTTEYPWIYVRKEIIEDNLDLHDESSDFLPVRDHISEYPDKNMLIGFAPSSEAEGQFYICLTEAGRDAVIRSIEALRLEQENRVRNAVYKSPGKWQDQGSAAEIDETIVKNTRPLYEIEVESTPDILQTPVKLTDRNADGQRDGYVELLPYRQSFDNVKKQLVTKQVQTTLPPRDNYCQTEPRMLINSWFQYRYDDRTINVNDYNEEKGAAFKRFLEKSTEDVFDKVLQNATWDIYTDDYTNLVRDPKDIMAPIPIAYTEHQSYYDGKLTGEKVINDLSWHPFWTGVAAATYTEHSKSSFLTGQPTQNTTTQDNKTDNKILIWSFDDCLSPKLILECPREVTSVSFCPLDGNVILGGCANGQIAIWSIPRKIEEVEAVIVNTPAQVKYHTAMRSLVSWMKGSEDSSIIQPAAISSLQYSQKEAITQIVWLPPYNKIDKSGRIESLQEGATIDELSWQFVTSSLDGTIAFWDLRWEPPEEKDKAGARGRKRKKIVEHPKPLAQSISPYKALNEVFRPFYMLDVKYPEDEKPIVITTMSIYCPKMEKEAIEQNSTYGKDDSTVRKYYRLKIAKPEFELEAKILVGTVDGNLVHLTWEGFDFTTGVFVNRENAKIVWKSESHDGPVTHAIRSKYLNDVVLTIGGSVFAVWREDFEEPVIWKKSKVRYTACCWGTLRPTVVILGQADGTAEIWDFIVKTHEPSFTQGLSGRIITGIYTHELYLNPQCIALCDYNGTFRLFTTPQDMLNYDVSDIKWMKRYIDREVDRIHLIKRSQKQWNESKDEDAERKKREAELEEKRKLEEELKKVEIDVASDKKTDTTVTKRKPGEFLEEARMQWKAIELERMQRVILEKKGLREDVLERRRAPFLKLRQDAKRKKRKIREIMQLQDQIFEDTIAFLFPEQHYYDRGEKEKIKLPQLEQADEQMATLKEVLEAESGTKFRSPQEQIIYDFIEIQSQALANIKARPYEPQFDWQKVLTEGKLRRESMDVEKKWNME